MGFPLCNHEQDLGVFGKQHTLKLASSCHWRAARILPRTNKNSSAFHASSLTQPVLRLIFSFVISWKDLCLRVSDSLAACL